MTTPSMDAPLRRIILLLLFLTGLLILVWKLPLLPALLGTHVMSLPMHIFMETFSITIAFMVFGVAYATRAERTEPVVFLGCALLVVGLLDFGHMLSYKGMPDFVTPAGAEKAINFWLAARGLFALAMLVFALLPWQRLASSRLRHWLLAGGLFCTGLIYWLALYHQQLWPRTFIEGQGMTPFKINAEYTIIAIMLLAAALIFGKARKPATPYAAASLFAALIISCLSELAFTLYADVTDIVNMTGHLYKVLAYGFIYHAVLVTSIREPFQRLGQANAQLSQAKMQYATLSELAPVGIFRTDVAGVCLYVNERWSKITGLSLAESLDRNFFMTIHPKDRKRIDREWAITVRNRQEFNDEYRLQSPDGNITWVLGRVRAELDDNGQLLGYVGSIIDISDRKKAEEKMAQIEARLQQAQKMEAIGTLAGGIAHDFNNILAIILGYGEMAKDDAPPVTKIGKDIDNILIAANRAKELVKQILAFSRQSQPEKVPMMIQPLIKEVLKMLRSSIPSTISITEEIDSNSGIVEVDPTQVHQILMNLCTNAYHAMEESGGDLSVTLKTTLIRPDEQGMLQHVNPGEYLELTVSDTGSGIMPDVIEKIFDPYFTTKVFGKGTGMGLSIIHGIMADYGGTITVESQLGEGSTFHVYFPVVDKEALPEIQESEDLPQGSERILFVDDEELLAEMGKDMLERSGYHVTVRRSSFEALESFQNSPNEFDLVITDQTMPGMTGSDLARRMLQIRADIPIILCTGYSNVIDENSAKALGIKEFALKPLTKGIIVKLIRQALNK